MLELDLMLNPMGLSMAMAQSQIGASGPQRGKSVRCVLSVFFCAEILVHIVTRRQI